MCKNVTPLFYHLPTQVPKSPHCSQDSESAKILAVLMGGLGYHRPACLKKDQKLEFFCSKPFGNLNFKFSLKLLVFFGLDILRFILQ
jgi:hypothetical protein